MTGWKIVPIEATEAMEDACYSAHARTDTVFASVPEMWRAMLAASPQPTDAEIGELCRMMWPNKSRWSDKAEDWQEPLREEDRQQMRAFLAALTGQQEK